MPVIRASTCRLALLCLPLALAPVVLAQRDPDLAPRLPQVLTLRKALEISRQRGFDLLVAEASWSSAWSRLCWSAPARRAKSHRCLLEDTRLGPLRVSEGFPLVPEELGFEQRLRNGRAIQLDEGRVPEITARLAAARILGDRSRHAGRSSCRGHRKGIPRPKPL